MKKIIAALFLSFIILSCTDTKKQEKDLFNEVIKVHDSVMSKDQLIMINKMQLDTLIKQNKTPEITAEATKHSKALDAADTNMEAWMHNFDVENKGKSHDEIMTYLADQKKQIKAIDKELNAAVATSASVHQTKQREMRKLLWVLAHTCASLQRANSIIMLIPLNCLYMAIAMLLQKQ
jgi:ribosomal silencing factor RsfS